jgi:hypothetical protein
VLTPGYDGNSSSAIRFSYNEKVVSDRTRIRGGVALVAGAAVTFVGIAILFLVVKGLGDLLFPEIPGLTFIRALLYESLLMLLDGFLFFEGWRLLKAARSSSQG